jgi:hypothetical protein
LAVVALLVEALALHQLSMVVAFGQHQLSGVHTLPAEVSADQLPPLASITVALA